MIAHNFRRSKTFPGGVEDVEAEENGGTAGDRRRDEKEGSRVRVPEEEESGGRDGRRDGGLRRRKGGERERGKRRVERDRGIGMEES